jgi:hypothetical protein
LYANQPTGSLLWNGEGLRLFFYIFIGVLVFVLALIITAIAQPPNKLVEHFTQSKTSKKTPPPPPKG